MVVIRSFSD